MQTKGGLAVKLPWAHLRIPPFPQVAIRILQLTNNEDASMRQLSDLISSEPAFSSEVLTIANSALYAPLSDQQRTSGDCHARHQEPQRRLHYCRSESLSRRIAQSSIVAGHMEAQPGLRVGSTAAGPCGFDGQTRCLYRRHPP